MDVTARSGTADAFAALLLAMLSAAARGQLRPRAAMRGVEAAARLAATANVAGGGAMCLRAAEYITAPWAAGASREPAP